MRRLLYILSICLLTISTLPAQNMDSLWSVWQDTTQVDTNRLKAFNEFLTNSYIESKPDSALYYTNLQYDLSKKINNKKWIANSLLKYAFSFYYSNDIEKALDYLDSLLELRKEIGDDKEIYNCYILIGKLEGIDLNPEKALYNYKKGLEISKKMTLIAQNQ